MPSEREKLARDINGLKERITLAWVDVISKPMAPAERRELSKSVGSLVEQLDDLQSRLDQLPKSKA
jgi:flagellar hook-associated protein FlgK